MILFLEPFYGGSHKAFADGLVKYSRHDIRLVTQAARFWKWRMRGAAIHFAQKTQGMDPKPRLVLCTDLMDAAHFRAMCDFPEAPIVLYFHENQLSYPVPKGQAIDYQFGFTNIASALAADICLFNSNFHREQFLAELPMFVRMMPDYRLDFVSGAIEEKSRVVHLGCDFEGVTPQFDVSGERPLVLWNHRWEFDKDPDAFFACLYALDEAGVEFDLAVVGENFQVQPTAFLEAREKLAHRVAEFGFVEDAARYRTLLERADLVISTAHQENFGVSVVEAVRAGAFPLLPDRLVYPEIIPAEFHADVLYAGADDLRHKAANFLKRPAAYRPLREDLSRCMGRFDFRQRIAEFDEILDA